MNKKTKIILSILLISIWLFIIYNFSSMDNANTNGLSKGIIFKVVQFITNYNYNDTMNIVNTINTPIRKCAHMFEFCILGIIIYTSILNIKNKYNNKYLFISILLCFIFACFDEYHQLFVSGRTGQFIDVLVDTTGSIIGCIIITIIYKLKYKNKENITNN